LCKEDLNSNGNQFHQYQQNELKQDPLTNVPYFSQFQIPALIAVHVYVVIYLCDSIWSVSESVYVFVIICLYKIGTVTNIWRA
jgi:hypothetical protein